MTDFAKPDSLPFRSYYLQQRRKKRKAANALVQRYITSLSAAANMYFQPSSSPSITRIVMDVNSPTGSNTGLPTGAPVPTANILQTLDFSYSGTLPTFGKNGSEYFTGEILNIKAYNGSVLIFDVPVDEDWKTSTDLHDAQGNVVGSAINVTENEAEKFTKVDGGANWLGEELVTQEVWENPNTVGSEWSFSNNQWELIGTGDSSGLRLIGTVNQPDIMRLSGNCADLAGQLAVENTLANYIAETGGYSFDLNKTSIGVQQYVRLVGVVNATLDKPSIKRLIPIAGGA